MIVGGESGGHARPLRLEWVRDLVAQCRKGGVAPFVKQLGADAHVNYYDEIAREFYTENGWDWPDPIGWSPCDGQPALTDVVEFKTNDRKGGDWNEWPEDLRVREFPKEAPCTPRS